MVTGPYIQSERLPIYREYVEKLITQGDAYYCFTTEEGSSPQEKSRRSGDYDSFPCAHTAISPSMKQSENRGRWKYVIRMKIPKGDDYLYWWAQRKISVPSADIDDQVLLKLMDFRPIISLWRSMITSWKSRTFFVVTSGSQLHKARSSLSYVRLGSARILSSLGYSRADKKTLKA